MLGQGLYDVAEVSSLTGVAVDRVVRWSNDNQRGPAVIVPMFPPMFAFADLVCVQIAQILDKRSVPDRSLRHGVETLRQTTKCDRPLSRRPVIETLATSGVSFLALEGEDYVDIGLGRQGVFQDVARIHLEKVVFDAGGGPRRWAPVEGVLIDPTIQAGAPCLQGTRVPTAVVAGLLNEAEADDVAWELDLSVEAVKVAQQFEALLAEGAGLPV